ncbi:MAG: glutamine amidotransferase [Thermoleophilia bacterium]|nr:glutamine amidotransferase [Thermoleophilia bacterium]
MNAPTKSSAAPHVRILHLYDQYLNIYADRGNIAVLTQRLAWRGIASTVTGLGIGETFASGDTDLIYVGGGQDRDQRMIAERMHADLQTPITQALEEGTPLLAVCGGYQLLGHEYLDVSGTMQPGVGVFDLRTTAGNTRLIGNVSIETQLPRIGVSNALTTTIVGFENHAGRTVLGPDAQPLGKVINGNGNDGSSGFEGCRKGVAIGTYLHGPLLPRNPELADWLLTAALVHAGGTDASALINEPIDASIEALSSRAHGVSMRRAKTEAR